MRIAVAVEVEVPDGTDILALPAPEVRLGRPFNRLPTEVVRWEIHPDPAAVFPEPDECDT